MARSEGVVQGAGRVGAGAGRSEGAWVERDSRGRVEAVTVGVTTVEDGTVEATRVAVTRVAVTWAAVTWAVAGTAEAERVGDVLEAGCAGTAKVAVAAVANLAAAVQRVMMAVQHPNPPHSPDDPMLRQGHQSRCRQTRQSPHRHR